MKYSLSDGAIAAIEKTLNKDGPKEVVVKIEKGEIVVLKVEKQKIL